MRFIFVRMADTDNITNKMKFSIPDGAQLFSLTHPYNEMFPILCKMKGLLI